MKCTICKAEIDTVFLGKARGTIVKDEKGKQHLVCFSCQKKFKGKKELLSAAGEDSGK